MPSPPRGFTLIELLVALVLVECGLLAVAGTAAAIVRAAESGRARAAAVRAGTDRLETLGAGPCVAAAGSATGDRGIREEWVVEVLPNGTRDIRDSVVFLAGGLPHAVALRTRAPC
jgi:Tfp pilus assembly protein PilV